MPTIQPTHSSRGDRTAREISELGKVVASDRVREVDEQVGANESESNRPKSGTSCRVRAGCSNLPQYMQGSKDERR